MATAGITTITGTDELEDYLNELIDGPTLEQWHRELLQQERERDYLAEKRDNQLARVETYIDEFPF